MLFRSVKEKEKPQTGKMVEIKVNNIVVEIHRGRQTVATIKQKGGVPLADDLNQMIDGQLVQLPDDGSVTIKGGEEFFSQPKTGGDS